MAEQWHCRVTVKAQDEMIKWVKGGGFTLRSYHFNLTSLFKTGNTGVIVKKETNQTRSGQISEKCELLLLAVIWVLTMTKTESCLMELKGPVHSFLHNTAKHWHSGIRRSIISHILSYSFGLTLLPQSISVFIMMQNTEEPMWCLISEGHGRFWGVGGPLPRPGATPW